MSTKNRVILDVALLAAIVVAYAPSLTGVSIHEWLSVAILVPSLVHLVLNWDWVVRFAKTTAERLRATTAVNAMVDVALFVAAVAVVLSGLVISQAVLPALGISLGATSIWYSLHSLSADATVVLMLVHFALHAKWMAAVLNSTLNRFDRAEEPVS